MRCLRKVQEHERGNKRESLSFYGEKIAKALAVLSTDLSNPYDESTDSFRPFSAPFTVDSPINEATLRAALKIGARYEIDISDLDTLGEGYGGAGRAGFKVLQGAR